MRKLLDSLENAQKAWVDLKKDAKGAHKLFKDYQPEEDLVKREKIIYTGRSEERRVGKECRSRWSPYH